MANKKWLQNARKSMERRNTVGAFTDFCGGRVTNDCIERGLNSKNPLTRKRAQFASNVRKMQPGGFEDPNAVQDPNAMQQQPMQPMQPLPTMQPQPVAPIANPAAPTPQLQTAAPTTGPAVAAQTADAAGAAGGSGNPGIDAAAQGAEMVGNAISENSDKKAGKTAGGALKGAGKGAAMGASIGTMIMPGIGTAIGAGIGAIGGATVGGIKARKAAKAAEDEKLAAQQDQLNQAAANIQNRYGNYMRYQMGGTALPGGMLHMQYGNFSKDKADVKTQFMGQDIPDDKGFEMKSKSNTITFQGQNVPIPDTKLPGGVQMPIGYGVDKFIGNKHDQAGNGSDSGIILKKGGKGKPGLEVEDGELQTKVKTTKGEKSYIVSDYIINPETGNTIAEDMEREIKAARTKKQADAIKQKYVKLNEQLKDDGEPEMVRAQKGTVKESYDASGDYSGGALSAEEANVGQQESTGEGTYGEATLESVEEMKARNPWYDFTDFDPSNSEDVLAFQKAYNERAPKGKEKIKEDGKYGTQTDSVKLDVGLPKLSRQPLQTLDTGVPKPEFNAKMQELGEIPQTEKPGREFREKKDKGVRPRFTGTTLQAFGPLANLRDAMNPERVAPEYAKAPRFGRVNLDRERAEERGAAAATSEAASRSMAGPAAFAARQSTAAQSAARQRGISSAEGRENVEIASREKAMEADTSKFNASAKMQADARNQDAVNLARRVNLQRRDAARDQLGRIATQTVADYNQQHANIGSDLMEYGPVAQDYYANVYRGNVPFVRGINVDNMSGMSPEEVAALYNQRMEKEGTTEEKPKSKRGGYIKKSGRVRRRKSKK